MMCQMISEGIASCLGRIRAKDQIAPAELESVLGVVINLTLDEHFIEQLQQHGAMGLLKDSLTVSATPGCTSRALAAAARIARHAAAADDAIRVGVFDMFLEKLKRLRETPADDLDHCVRGVAQCLKVTGASAGRRLMQEEGVLEALLAVLSCSREHAVGNAALVIQVLANEEANLAALGRAGCVKALLDVVHYQRGPAQKNAALALARVVKLEANLSQLKALHGFEILNSYLRM
ncbi:hypothetical protein GUITHDRAFT_151836 [Guillardia theta CCMP2712]|uniref:Armadillo repeat-containing domain-containing protein n=1 Tax=Guillardia theta (strain CCMP2712) TaxID=905079 RepID=L1JJB7_GUITC|nr:hypothetical protein GUITHDRAFT_151836 [Guillardia theta CCMP2712]EKX48244.1 hypothetical protein GUITHDRAFT_151836 [Guillardia theta CCMP2712]|eukprot:XP_005835224.1 hypothetical protein GUITHDRAFT_151836 [Guillardia theta CCMP2712]